MRGRAVRFHSPSGRFGGETVVMLPAVLESAG
jgi:hypothetical protein